jgi:lipid-A-disaccharide synthase-like uncharacterized protein
MIFDQAIPWQIEAVYLLSQVLYFGRSWIQTKESIKAKKSVNPDVYWWITILAGLLLIVYAYLIGSLAMIVSNIILIGYSFLHMRINSKPEEAK